jgi:hypothetical protein
MTDLAERNRRILQRKAEGASQRVIAREFGLSPSRIGLVVRADQRERERQGRHARMVDILRQCDDPDRRWRGSHLLDLFVPMTTTRRGLKLHFKARRINAMSLREFMNVLVPDADEFPSDSWAPPIFAVRQVGKKGFGCIIRRLSEVDLGPRCRAPWNQKLDRLKRGGWV